MQPRSRKRIKNIRREKKLDEIGNHLAFHNSHDRAAFISAAFEKGVELYVAEDVSKKSDIPSAVYQLTSDTAGGVYNPQWKKGNYLAFQKNLSKFEVKVPRSYRILEHKMNEECVVDVEETLEKAEMGDY